MGNSGSKVDQPKGTEAKNISTRHEGEMGITIPPNYSKV